MKDVSEMNYSEFTLLLSEDTEDRFETILDYPDGFYVLKDVTTERYYYLEGGINDASDFFEVACIARLKSKEPINVDAEYMSEIFDCDVCGERLTDSSYFEYLWFKEIPKSKNIKGWRLYNSTTNDEVHVIKFDMSSTDKIIEDAYNNYCCACDNYGDDIEKFSKKDFTEILRTEKCFRACLTNSSDFLLWELF